jgi:YD repeat-containing protein
MDFKNGDKYIYNSDLRISEIQNRDKKSLSLSYSSGNLATITDTLGRVIFYSYTASGLIERVTEPGGRQVEFSYFTTGSTA